MNIVQITPGAGRMYCGNCLRDNALVAELRKLGHSALMVPLYLPLTLDETDQSDGMPVFFGGFNVYLDQKSRLFRHAPGWLRRLLAARRLLNWAAGRAAKTQPADVGGLTVSMLRGEQGRQARELDDLVGWLRTHEKPDVVCLSNALLLGLARRLRSDVGTAVVCMLQGEDAFLDALPEPHRTAAWTTLAERASDVDLFVAPSRYFGELMSRRLGLAPDRVRVVPNGIDLAGYDDLSGSESGLRSPTAPVLGFFARMCRDKGLDTLVEAFIRLKADGRAGNLRLLVGGSCGPADEPFVKTLRQQLAAAGCRGQVEFHPNVSREEKLDFLGSLTVFSVPARYGEAFGLYVLEALAAGVPAVLPRTAAFPELVEATGGGVLCEPENPPALAEAVAAVLREPAKAQALGAAGRRSVFEKFSAAAMTRGMMGAFVEARARRWPDLPTSS